jgi:hypothetical protein
VSEPERPADVDGAPVRWRERVDELRTALMTRTGVAAVALVLGLALGVVVMQTTTDDAHDIARRAVDVDLLPLAIDADNIWTSSDARASVSDALVALRRDGNARPVEQHLDEWLDAYDNAILQIAGLHLPRSARPVQRQVIHGVTLSRDAVEVLGHAASISGVEGQQAQVEEFLVEVGRLRQRSEHLLQAARAASGDLADVPVDVGPLPPVTPFPRRPS